MHFFDAPVCPLYYGRNACHRLHGSARCLGADRVVSPAELQSAAVASTQARQQNIETLQQFVSSPAAEKALQSAHIDGQQVKSAVSRLSDQELAQISSRASKANADFAAGTLSDRDLIIILVAVAALILIIVAVR